MFFGEEERASPVVIDAMTRTANKFSARWEFSSPPDAKWIHLWSNFLGDMTPDEIDRAADYFVKAFRRHLCIWPAHGIGTSHRHGGVLGATTQVCATG